MFKFFRKKTNTKLYKVTYNDNGDYGVATLDRIAYNNFMIGCDCMGVEIISIEIIER